MAQMGRFLLSTTAANLALNAITKRLDGGSVRIYSGPRPGAPDTSPDTRNQLLVEFALVTPSFEPADAREAIGRPFRDPAGAQIRIDGEASWVRFVAADGEAVLDGDAGTMPTRADAPAPLVVLPVSRLQAGVSVQVLGMRLRLPLAA